MLGVDSMAHQFLPAFAHPHDPAAGGPGFWATDYGDRTGMGGRGGHRRLESGKAMPPDPTGGPQQQQAPPPPPAYHYTLPPQYMAPGMYGHPPMPTLPPPPAPVPTSALLGLPPSAARPGGMSLPPHPMLGPAGAPRGPLPAPVQQHHHGAHSGGRQRSMACMACRHSKLHCTKERPACKRYVPHGAGTAALLSTPPPSPRPRR